MKNKTLRIIILTIILVLFVQLTSYAALGKLTLQVKTNKNTYKVGEKVTVTIDWTKEVEAAGFVLKYDKTKLAFASTSLGSNFYNAETAGKVLFNWAAFDGKGITNVKFEFTTKAEGDAKIYVENAKGFADSDLKQATGYVYKSKTIQISNVEDTEDKEDNVKPDKPSTGDKENETKPSKPNKPSTDNNKNEVTPSKPNTNENKNEIETNKPNTNEIVTDKPNTDDVNNNIVTDNNKEENYNKIEQDSTEKQEAKRKLTSTEVKTILIIALLINVGLIVLITKKRN